MKISHFIIGILIVGMFVVIFNSFASQVVLHGGATYDNTTIIQYNKFTEIYNITQKIQQNTENISTNRNLADIIGGFYADTKNTLTLASTSVNSFNDLNSKTMTALQIPQLYPYIVAIVLVLIFLGVIIAVIVGRDEI